MSSFGLVSTQTQYLISNMLLDDTFIEKFIVESRERLEKRHGVFTKGLENIGINTLESNAGLFCWMDLRSLLKENTFEKGIENSLPIAPGPVSLTSISSSNDRGRSSIAKSNELETQR
ncbi:hypothetical protein KY284_010099 [Solanum tuberosum]|nr:hypothetical protein KY284_010099 [Solanum tuberosum]